MKNELTLKANEFGLDEKQAETITNGLRQILKEREVLEAQYSEVIKSEICEENIPMFKELRLKIRDNRTKGINNWHKTNKEFYLRGGQFVDAIKRKESEVNERMEDNLLSNETHFEKLEAERIDKLRTERTNALLSFGVENIPSGLGEMQNDVYESFLSSAKQKHTEKLEAEKNAEQDRIAKEKAEAAEREAQRLENIRLKAEAEKREAEIQAENKKREASEKKRQESEARERKEREAKEADERAENEAKLKAEREAKAKLEAELQAKKEVELKAAKEADEVIQRELSKGDSEKVKDLINDLNSLKSKYAFDSDKNKKMYSEIQALLDKVVNHIIIK